ncbi:unnamed protein product [Musa acuminata var. zebrina]
MEAPAVNYSRHASPTSIHPSMHLLFCLPLPPTNTCYQIYKSLNFTLMQDEYLTSVSGYVKYDCSEFPCVSQLTFTTNLGKTYGPYGGGGGTFFEVNVEYDEIKGFFGQATTEYLTAFGVYQSLISITKYLNTNYVRCLIHINYLKIHCEIFFWFGTMNHDPYYFFDCLILAGTKKVHEKVCNPFDYPFNLQSILSDTHQFDSSIIKVSRPIIISKGMEIKWSGLIEKETMIKGGFKIPQNSFNRRPTHSRRLVHTLASLFIMAHKGWLSQHHVDSKCSEILFSCMTKEALNLVIFYVDFEKGSTPTSIWTVCLCKIGGKRELRYTWKFRTVVFDIPRNGGEVLEGGRGRQKNRCMEVGEACLE